MAQAEAAVTEHYSRLARLAYLLLPCTLAHHRRVRTAHAVTQRALPRGRKDEGPDTRSVAAVLALPGQRQDARKDTALDARRAAARDGTPGDPEDATTPDTTDTTDTADTTDAPDTPDTSVSVDTPDTDLGYAYVRVRVVHGALEAGLPRQHLSWQQRLYMPPLLPLVWGLRLVPCPSGPEERALDQRLSALPGPARAAYLLRVLERLTEAQTRQVLAAAGVIDPEAALQAAAALPAPGGRTGPRPGTETRSAAGSTQATDSLPDFDDDRTATTGPAPDLGAQSAPDADCLSDSREETAADSAQDHGEKAAAPPRSETGNGTPPEPVSRNTVLPKPRDAAATLPGPRDPAAPPSEPGQAIGVPTEPNDTTGTPPKPADRTAAPPAPRPESTPPPTPWITPPSEPQDAAPTVRPGGETTGAPGAADRDGVPLDSLESAAVLLGSAAFDPCSVQARPTNLLRRRQRVKAGLVAACAVLVSGALLGLPGHDGTQGGMNISAPSTAADAARKAALDPGKLIRAAPAAWRTSTRTDYSVWPARGVLADDEALLRRALAAWARPSARIRLAATPGTPLGAPPGPAQLLYAGEADHVRVVLLYDGLRVVRYAEPAGHGRRAVLDLARVDGADAAEATALVVDRSRGAIRYLTAPWVRGTAVRDLLQPDAPAAPLHRSKDGVTAAVPEASPPGLCPSVPVLQVQDSGTPGPADTARTNGTANLAGAAHPPGGAAPAPMTGTHRAPLTTRLLADLGEPVPAHLTSGRPTAPGEASGRDALRDWAHIGCSLAVLRVHGVRSVNSWQYAQERLPEANGTASWLCTRAETWRGTGDRVLVAFQVPGRAAIVVVARARELARVRQTYPACPGRSDVEVHRGPPLSTGRGQRERLLDRRHGCGARQRPRARPGRTRPAGRPDRAHRHVGGPAHRRHPYRTAPLSDEPEPAARAARGPPRVPRHSATSYGLEQTAECAR